MALVCDDSQSVEEADKEAPALTVEAAATPAPPETEENDLEDGEIEDDEEENEGEVPELARVCSPPPGVLHHNHPLAFSSPSSTPSIDVALKFTPPPGIIPGALGGDFLPKGDRERDRGREKERERRRRGGSHDDGAGSGGSNGKKKHMTEAEKSILHLRKRERMQREKWEKSRKEQVVDNAADDFASNIEKAIANALKKDKQQGSDEEKDDQHSVAGNRGKKRRNRDKQRQNKSKQRKLDVASKSDVDEGEFLNVRGGGSTGSPDLSHHREDGNKPDSPRSEDSYDSDYSSPEDNARQQQQQQRNVNDVGGANQRANKRDYKNKNKRNNRDRKFRDKSRDRNQQRNNNDGNNKDSQGICVFFLQGKCQNNDCPYSHEAVPPMKLELCKFYMMGCCAKGDKCSYMHSEFPCRFYHTGLPCHAGDDCKFAHGKPLSEGLRQILYKHIETAPREILGDFPRMNREEALGMIDACQKGLQLKYGGPVTTGKEETITDIYNIDMPIPQELLGGGQQDEGKKRMRPSRWQDPEPAVAMTTAPPPSFLYHGNANQDQDMRINSNGDVDMRTLPPPPQTTVAPSSSQDVDIRNSPMMTAPVAVATTPAVTGGGDVDIRQLVFEPPPNLTGDGDFPADLPKTQRDLFARIKAQQRDDGSRDGSDGNDGNRNDDNNINWYSDDDEDDDEDDENRLTIGDVDDDAIAEGANIMSPPQIRPLDVVEKLGDLSKIDISAEVTKLLSSISQGAAAAKSEAPPSTSRDPRAGKPARRDSVLTGDDGCQGNSGKQRGVSIYEQGSFDAGASLDDDSEGNRGRPDVDLRNFSLMPFSKGMLNYTPAKEIDASFSSHPPIVWKVHDVEIPQPNYAGLKLNVQDAEKTGDPRLRKIFRLSVDEKDSPASPKSSPKQSFGSVRIDPRLKKLEEASKAANPIGDVNLTYNQQLSILQSSAFFQSLTSNQKLLLNQELASRNEQNNTHDPVLNSMLTNLNLIPPNQLQLPVGIAGNVVAPSGVGNFGAALSILAKLNPMGHHHHIVPPNSMMNPSLIQPGLLGAAPGIPNMAAIPPPQQQQQQQPEFPINFDPRNGGLLGNAPQQPQPFLYHQQQQQQQQQDNGGPFINSGNYGNYDDDYYGNQQQLPQQQQQQQDYVGGGGGSVGGGGGGRQNNHHGNNNNNNNRNDNRGFQRDRRRGRNNFGRNNNNNNNNRNNFRNNRNRNRTHSPS